jgi:hypothetical protein
MMAARDEMVIREPTSSAIATFFLILLLDLTLTLLVT